MFLKNPNDFLLKFTVPYTPKTNAIEIRFNQIKHTLKEQVDKSIKSKENKL